MKKTKVLKIIGNIITVLCLGFIIYSLATFDIDYSILLNAKVLAVVLACGALMCMPVFINAVSYRKLLQLVGGQNIAFSQIRDLYASANIAKYLPGNVMHYASRNIIGSRYGISNKKVFTATVLEVGLKIITAVVLIMIMAFDYLKTVITQGYNGYLVWAIAAIFVLIIGLLIFVYFKFKEDIKLKQFVSKVMTVFLLDSVIYLINILCFALIASVIVQDFSLILNSFLIISGVHLTAWLVGYLTPGAPGGIGVKEVVMVLLMGGLMVKSDVLLVTVLLRIASILGDSLAFGVNKLILGRAQEN
ncbi:MAG: lysylphosphatidylglycerol synthase domain-containing protein [Eubacteriales bacterium]